MTPRPRQNDYLTFIAETIRSKWRLNFTAGAAVAHHAHQKITEAIVKPLDVREHRHRRMVLAFWRGVNPAGCLFDSCIRVHCNQKSLIGPGGEGRHHFCRRRVV
jgi:hypothetical protein